MTRELFIVTLTPQPGVAGLLALRALLKVALTPAERQKLYAERQQNGLVVLPVVEWHPGELVPRVGFIVTDLARPAERVVAFYNRRGTAEQWIKIL
jgi:hypothetical protein